MKRKNYISWDDYFMGIALLSAKRSKDPGKRVGSCIVNKYNKIIGIGYNGFPIGCSDDDLPWNSESDDILEKKNTYVVHSEVNAILNSTMDLHGAKLYVLLYPCNECAKIIIQSGIKEVVYLQEYRHTDSAKATERMFKLAGIETRQFKPHSNKIIINFENIFSDD